jgi:RNA polymerase sigma-70 factor (ECF subfamily)
MEPVAVNGQPGARVIDADGHTLSVMALDIADGHVRGVYNMLNPDKLRHLR